MRLPAGQDIWQQLGDTLEFQNTPSEDLLALFKTDPEQVFPEVKQVRQWTPGELRETVHREVALREVGKLIERAREYRGWTTRELALKAGVSQPRVMQIQAAGESLGISTLVKFASALGFRVRIELVPEEGGDPIKAS